MEIGLLIGRNVRQAMKTREVVNEKDDEPWAERYDLGWTIIGNVYKKPKENDSNEAFKVNRIVIEDNTMTKSGSSSIVVIHLKEKASTNTFSQEQI